MYWKAVKVADLQEKYLQSNRKSTGESSTDKDSSEENNKDDTVTVYLMIEMMADP